MIPQYIKMEDLEVSPKPYRTGKGIVVFTSKDSIDDFKVRLSVTFNRVHSRIYDRKNNKQIVKFENWTPDEALQTINEYLRFYFYRDKTLK